MRGVICDICGALSDPDDVRERRGVFQMPKQLGPQTEDEAADFIRMLTGGRAQAALVDTYDFCGECAGRLVAMLRQQRVNRV